MVEAVARGMTIVITRIGPYDNDDDDDGDGDDDYDDGGGNDEGDSFFYYDNRHKSGTRLQICLAFGG